MKALKICFLLIMVSTKLFAIDDLRDKSWTEAFKIVHANVEMYYPFVQHKCINLDSLYQATLHAIERAEKTHNDTAFLSGHEKICFGFP